MAIPNYRISVDWDNDGMFNQGVATTDALNLVPEPVWLDFTDRVGMSSGVSAERVAVETDYGLVAWEVTLPSSGGVSFGSIFSADTDVIPVSPSTAYRWRLRFKGISVFAGHSVYFNIRDEHDTLIGSSATVAITGDWQTLTVQATTDAASSFITFTSVKSATAGDTVVQYTGFQQTLGTATYPWNAGSISNAYDDISSYILQADWNGQTSEETRVPSESSASIILDNTGRLFSPEYASGALYGFHQEGLRVKIELQRPSTDLYEIVWIGWIEQFGVVPGGMTGNLQASIDAVAGMFNLDEINLRSQVQEDVYFEDVFDTIIEGGWYSPSSPWVAIADKSHADSDAWTPDLDDMRTLDPGLTEFPLVGDDWASGETKPTAVLKDLMEVERGWLLLDREGNFIFKNREAHLYTATPDDSLDFDLEANKGEYIYSKQAVNTVDVTYYNLSILDDQTVWSTREDLEVPTSDRKLRQRVKFRYPEERKITVKSLNAFGASSPNSTYVVEDAEGNNLDDDVIAIRATLLNGEAMLHITNLYTSDVYVSVVLRGTIERTADPEVIDVVSDDLTLGIRNKQIDNRLVRNRRMAIRLGEYYLAFFGYDFGQFTQITVEARDEDWLERMMDIQVGQLIEITEYQTGVTDKRAVIIGEAWEVTPSHARVTYTFGRTDDTEYWLLGTSELGEGTTPVY